MFKKILLIKKNRHEYKFLIFYLNIFDRASQFLTENAEIHESTEH